MLQMSLHAEQPDSTDEPLLDEDGEEPHIKESLLVWTAKARKDQPTETEGQKRLREEQDMMRNITARTALRGVKELATVSPHLHGPDIFQTKHLAPPDCPCLPYLSVCITCLHDAHMPGHLQAVAWSGFWSCAQCSYLAANQMQNSKCAPSGHIGHPDCGYCIWKPCWAGDVKSHVRMALRMGMASCQHN